MSDVTFITSPGIRQIVTANKALARHGGRLVLLQPNETVVRVLGATGVSGLVTLVYSERDATTALRTG